MNKRFAVELAIIVTISVVFLWFLPCYLLCSVDQIFPLTVRVFGLTLIGVWVLRTAKDRKWNRVDLDTEKNGENEIKNEREEVRIY